MAKGKGTVSGGSEAARPVRARTALSSVAAVWTSLVRTTVQSEKSTLKEPCFCMPVLKTNVVSNRKWSWTGVEREPFWNSQVSEKVPGFVFMRLDNLRLFVSVWTPTDFSSKAAKRWCRTLIVKVTFESRLTEYGRVVLVMIPTAYGTASLTPFSMVIRFIGLGSFALKHWCAS